MHVVVTCPCGRRYRVEKIGERRSITCRHCGEKIRLPGGDRKSEDSDAFADFDLAAAERNSPAIPDRSDSADSDSDYVPAKSKGKQRKCSMGDSPFNRRMLSKGGTILANLLLGTKLYDMTSGFQGFHRDIIGKLLEYPLKSRAHFYQTEVKYLLRKHRTAEVPIHYQAPSPRVSKSAVKNARETLLYYFWERLKGNTPVL